jgi:ribosomal protein S3AE
MASAKTTIKRKFYDVRVPFTTTKVHLYGSSLEQFENNVIKLDLTRNLRGKNLELRARVKKVGQELESDPISLELLPSFVRRMIRKGSDYVEDSFEIECKDGMLRVKPFLLTRKKVSRAIRNELRVTARKFIESHFKIRTTHELFSEMMANKIQRELFAKLKKIYPLSLCEIRVIETINRS